MVLLHNLGAEPAVVEFALPGEERGTQLVDLASDEVCTLDDDQSTELKLDGYGFRWLRVKQRHDPRLL